MKQKITYTLDWNDEENSDWQGPFDDVDDVMKLVRKAKRDASHPSDVKYFRAIFGAYNSLDIPSPHIKFGSLKSFTINLCNTLGEYQDYYNYRVSIVCYAKIHNRGCTVWFCHKKDYNFNKGNDWTPNEPATENYISVEVEDSLRAEEE